MAGGLASFVDGFVGGVDTRHKWADRKRSQKNEDEDREYQRETRDWSREDRDWAKENRIWDREDRDYTKEERERIRKAQDKAQAENDRILKAAADERNAFADAYGAEPPPAAGTPARSIMPVDETGRPAGSPALTFGTGVDSAVPAAPTQGGIPAPAPAQAAAPTPANVAPTPQYPGRSLGPTPPAPISPPGQPVADMTPAPNFLGVPPPPPTPRPDEPPMQRQVSPMPAGFQDPALVAPQSPEVAPRRTVTADYSAPVRQREDYPWPQQLSPEAGYGTPGPQQPVAPSGAAIAAPVAPPANALPAPAAAGVRSITPTPGPSAPAQPPMPPMPPMIGDDEASEIKRQIGGYPKPPAETTGRMTLPAMPGLPSPDGAPVRRNAAPPSPKLSFQPITETPSAIAAMAPKQKAQADQQVGMTVDNYMTKAGPQMVRFYLSRGEVEKAQKFETWMAESKTRESIGYWAKAVVAQNMGDEAGALDAFMDYYNTVGDGVDVVKDKSGFIRPEGGGDPTGIRLTFKREGTNETWTQDINGTSEILQQALHAFEPRAIYDKLDEQNKAAQKVRADGIKYDNQMVIAMMRAKGGDTTEDRIKKATEELSKDVDFAYLDQAAQLEMILQRLEIEDRAAIAVKEGRYTDKLPDW